ncbi:MAG: type II secretion system protein [Kiritimatiellae bacterium]|nr:type II secretion system protein [Kiritimatiellia bacterium]
MNHKNQYRLGFTLLELLIVIAIIAFVAVIGMRSYGNLKEIQAKKMNLSNIKRIQHTLATYNEAREGVTDRFNYFDSLIDAQQGAGAWKGTPGTYQWENTAVSGQPGIYDGSWKFRIALYNAAGQGSGAVASEEEAKIQNKGTRNTGLLSQLGIYFLSTNDCASLQEAGIYRYMLHNPSTGQSSAYCALKQGEVAIGGGGPGFRPDMSAYYPAYLEPGSPVAVVQPLSNARGGASVNTIFKDLGYTYTGTNTFAMTDTDRANVLSALNVKFVCFGIGQCAECVRNQLGLGEAPINSVYDKTNYRNYIAVFAIYGGGQGVKQSCHLAGVLDCAGKTYRAAEYDLNWTTTAN